MRLVVDTNVLVSALLKPESVPARALAAIWASAVLLHDPRIVEEYRAVLARPKFRAIDRLHIEQLFAAIHTRGNDLGAVPAWEGAMSDGGDRIFVEAALAGPADAIVTGNLRHFPSDLGFEVLPPATLLARLQGG